MVRASRWQTPLGTGADRMWRRGLTVVCVLAVIMAAPRPSGRDSAMVNIPEQGRLAGRKIVNGKDKLTLYARIPFAEPPVEELRFRPPRSEPLPSWDDERNGTFFAPACPQDVKQDIFLKNLMPDIKTDEDCLYLNVFMPDGNAPDGGWPVMIWFHPGGFETGAAEFWDGSPFAGKHKVLVVTAAYRLNIFGFLSTLDEASPGNYGLLDQVAVINWVHKQISVFNGSTSNIALCGDHAGGVSVGLHLLSPLSKGKFAKAITMSGNAAVPWSVKLQQNEKMKLASIAEKFPDCPTKSNKEFIECLKKIDAMELAMKAAELNVAWGPVVDAQFANESNIFLPKEPLDIIMDEEFEKVPLLAGYTDMEEALFFMERLDDPDKGPTKAEFENLIYEELLMELPESNDTCPINYQNIHDALLFYYSPQPDEDDTVMLRKKLINFGTEKRYGAGTFLQASYTSKYNPTFVYRFDYKLKTSLIDLPEWINVPNLFDLPLVWGMPFWTTPKRQWNSADKKISENVMAAWAYFIISTNPVEKSKFKWSPFTKETPTFLIIDTNYESINSSMSDSFDYRAFVFWNDYYPKVRDSATTCCNTTEGSSTNSINFGLVSVLAGVQLVLN